LSYTRRAPRLGEHTDEVLRAAGLQAAELDALRRDAII
jgi:crotonobetainyl-CoA:carnitine CoA-transferase CaiB-like acyl-CoA transferase